MRGHQNRIQTAAQIAHRKRALDRNGAPPWNKGISYVITDGRVYANKGSWMKAVRRVYGDICMRCGWNEATCDSHHIIAKASGGLNTLENSVVLCPNCHRLVHAGIVSTDELIAIRASASPLVT
jgi:5-methylcytosine-specific restriction endonuclease McrA